MTAITRAQFRDGVDTLLEAQMAATPGLLKKTARYHPGGMGNEKPVAWQGEISDELSYDAGTRARVMTEEVQIATTFPADIPTDDFDSLIDAIVERFTLNAGIVGTGTVIELISATPSDVAIPRADGNDLLYRGAVLGIRLRIWEGRD